MKRLAWAKEHQSWTSAQWSQVLFTDESKYQLFGNKRRLYVRRSVGQRMVPQCVAPTVKHGGGSVMVWGCFAGNEVGDLIQVEGILNKEGYLNILKKHAVPSGKRLVGRGFVFQQDNDPKHSSKLCKGYLENRKKRKDLKVMLWPAQSPDLNPIELLWDELHREVRKLLSKNTRELMENLKLCWRRISPETLRKLINRMPRVCKAVLKAKGGYFEESKI